jgi:WD40 repeat protein
MTAGTFDGSSTPTPATIRSRAEFAELLSALRAKSGQSFRTLGRLIDLPPTTISGWTSGKHLPYLRQADVFGRLITLLGATDEEAAAWIEVLHRLHANVDVRNDGEAPYQGLERFELDDVRWFFGRDDLVAAVVERIRDRLSSPDAVRIVAVVGASGAGKSSLVRAGVANALATGAIDGAPATTLVITPGSDPSRALAAISVSTGPALVVIDQFEEIFTLVTDEDVRSLFLAQVLEMSSGSAGVPVVLCLRSDYYAELAAYPAFAQVMQDQQVIVGAMSDEQLRSAIVEPARLAGVSVDAELVDVLLRDFAPRHVGLAKSTAGALPLLSHALLETWKRARRGQMRLSDYREIGGLEGALDRTAEAAFAMLDEGQQSIARSRLLRLVNIDDDGGVTRRRVPLEELTEPQPGSTSAQVEDVVDHFVAQRLLTTDTSTIEVSHEVLLSAWPRLREWIDADREGLLIARRLRDAARVWDETGRESEALASGQRLTSFAAWAATDRAAEQIGPREREYVAASSQHEQRLQVAIRRRRRVFAGLTAVSVVLALVAGSAALVALDARSDAERERNEALSRKVALQATQLAPNDPSLAAQLALVAYRTAPTVEARSALLDSAAMAVPRRFLSSPGSIALAVSPDDSTMAVSDAVEGTVHVFDLGDRGPQRRIVVPAVGEPSDYYALALSPDATLLAAGGTNTGVRLWRLTGTGAELIDDDMGMEVGGVQTLAFSPDGSELAAGADQGLVQRWRIAVDGAFELLEAPTTEALVKTVTWTPDGSLLLTGDASGALRVWDLDRVGEDVARVDAVVEGDELNSLDVSPDGTLVAAGYRSGTLRVFDLRAGSLTEASAPETSFTSWVNTVAFDSTGTRLAAGGSDSTAVAWEVGTWDVVRATLQPGPVTGLAFTDDDSDLIAVSTDGAARVWPLTGSPLPGARASIFNLTFNGDGSRLGVFPGRADGTSQLWDTSNLAEPVPLNLRIPLPETAGQQTGAGTITADGKVMVVGTSDGPSQLWQIDDATSPQPRSELLSGPTQLIEMVTASPDNRFVAVGSDDATTHIWDVSDPADPVLLPVLADAGSQILGVDFNADASLLATASADNLVRLYDYRDPQAPVLLATLDGFESYAQDVAFTDDSTLLAAGSADRTVRVWDITDPAAPTAVAGPIAGPRNYVYGLDFQPRTRLLAAADTDGTAWVWNLEAPANPVLVAALHLSEAQLFVANFSPDGTMLYGAGADRVVYAWPTDSTKAMAALCDRVGDRITEEEWELYLPEQQYAPPC